MLKEINKKLLENEQKLADFLHAKGVAASASKRPLTPHVMTSPILKEEQDGVEPSTKKFKPAWRKMEECKEIYSLQGIGKGS